MEFPWKEFKEEVLRSVRIEPKVIHSDNMCYVVQYGIDDFEEYKKRYDNKTKWCTTTHDSYSEEVVDDKHFIYVLHNVHNGLMYQTSTSYIQYRNYLTWFNMEDIKIDDIMSVWLTKHILESLLKVDEYLKYWIFADKSMYMKYRNTSCMVLDTYHGLNEGNSDTTCNIIKNKYKIYSEYMVQCYYVGLIDVKIGRNTYHYEQYYVPTRHNIIDMLDMLDCEDIPYEVIVNALTKFLDMKHDILDVIILMINTMKSTIIKLVNEGHMPGCMDYIVNNVKKLYYNPMPKLHELGIYNVPCEVGTQDVDIISKHQHDMVIPICIDTRLEEYYPNYPDYYATIEGRYSDIINKNRLIHFNPYVRFPIDMLKKAVCVMLHPDLPDDYRNILVELRNGDRTEDNKRYIYGRNVSELTDEELDYVRNKRLHSKIVIGDYKELVRTSHRVVMDIMLCSYSVLELVNIIGHSNAGML